MACFMKKMRYMKKNMRNGHAWSGSEVSPAATAPSPFSEHPANLEQRTGSCGAAFSPDIDRLRGTPPPSDGPANVFESEDSRTPVDSATSPPPPPPLKRPRRSPHSSAKLRAPQRRLARPPNKSLPPRTPHSRAHSEQTHRRRAQ